MSKYYKIYHYGKGNLQFIDPIYYGTGAARGAECKRGKTGLNKIYFYTEDKPETCVRCASTRYEVYLPFEWKDLVYDIYIDEKNLYDQVIAEIEAKEHRQAYDYEIRERREQLIYDLGYKGFRNSSPNNPLPHVVIFFYKLSALKPKDPYTAYDWAGNILNENKTSVGESQFGLFSHKEIVPTDSTRLKLGIPSCSVL